MFPRAAPYELEPRPQQAPALPDNACELLGGDAAHPPSAVDVARARSARASRSSGRGFRTRSHHSRWPALIATANAQKSCRDGEFVPRMSVARTTLRRSSALVKASRRKPSRQGPEPHVRVRRVLILNSADALERARNRKPGARGAAAPENGPVQLALGENALGHGSTILPACSRPSSRSSRCPPSASSRRGRTRR